MITEKDNSVGCRTNNAGQIALIKPFFSECDHCIVFCTDNNYTALTAVAIQSIVDHISTDEYYDILIFHSGINKEHVDLYDRQWRNVKNVKIRFVNLSSIFDGLNLYTENRTNFSREAYFRLVIPWVLSSSYKRALYLDGDMILRHDLSTVFHIDLGNTLTGAVRDYWGICNCYIENDPRKSYRISIGLDDIDNYVISATLLFNLDLWREKFTLEKVVSLCASRKWDQHDQDVVNILCQRNMTYLSPTWGLMEDYGNNHYLPKTLLRELEEVADPIIVHFGGRRKPYLEEFVKYDLEFWKYADETPYMADLFDRINSDEYKNYVAFSINKDGINTVQSEKGTEIFYKGVLLGQANQGYQRFRVIRINNQVLHIEGSVGFFGDLSRDSMILMLSVNGSFIHTTAQYEERSIEKRLKEVYTGYCFVFDVPLSSKEKKYSIKLKVLRNGNDVFLSRINYMHLAELSGCFINEYYSNDGWTVKNDEKSTSFIVTKNRSLSILQNEYKFISEIRKIKTPSAKKACILRPIALFLKLFQRKPIWLVSDRMERADDNGEVFYKYLKENKQKEVKTYFILLPSSKDYKRLKSLGGVITPHSKRHKLLALMAEWSISSQLDYLYRDPFWNYGIYYRDMLRKTRFVFMQHGVISNDLSRLLDKDAQELDGLVTSTVKEYDSVLKGNYHYTDKHVWLTGLPRFDRLQDAHSKIITIMPTWRMYLFSGQNHETGIWNTVADFSKTEYVTFYRDLLNNTRLKEVLVEKGYTLQFIPHPTCRSYIEDFHVPDHVKTVSDETSYYDIYKNSSLIVTDYSSSIYDFIYLRKPIVYCQFDADTYFMGDHISDKGDYDFEKDGFGEVTYNSQELVDVISLYLETGCALHEPYKTRIEKAFPDRESNHCERLYNRIREQGKY